MLSVITFTSKKYYLEYKLLCILLSNNCYNNLNNTSEHFAIPSSS